MSDQPAPPASPETPSASPSPSPSPSASLGGTHGRATSPLRRPFGRRRRAAPRRRRPGRPRRTGRRAWRRTAPRPQARTIFAREESLPISRRARGLHRLQEVRDARPSVQERGKILPRRITGTCSRHQRWFWPSHQESSEYRIVAVCRRSCSRFFFFFFFFSDRRHVLPRRKS